MLLTRQSSNSAVISAIKYRRAVFYWKPTISHLLALHGLIARHVHFYGVDLFAPYALALRLALLMIAPMFIDIGLQAWLGWQGDNATRLLTGIGAGAGLPAMILAMIVRFTKKSQAAPKGIQSHSQTYL